jgi:hypothetical protein
MLCFEVTVNGQYWCRAGIGEFGSMDAAVTWVGVEGSGPEPPTTLSVSGMPYGLTAVHWRDGLRRLVPGDVVEVRLVEGEPDPFSSPPPQPLLPWPPEPAEE